MFDSFHCSTRTDIPEFTTILYTGWWLSHPSEKMMDFVSWDDEIPPTEWKKNKQTTNQSLTTINHD